MSDVLTPHIPGYTHLYDVRGPPPPYPGSQGHSRHSRLKKIFDVLTSGRITDVKLLDGDIYTLSDRKENSVTCYSRSGHVQHQFGHKNTGSGAFIFDPQLNCLCVANHGTISRVKRDGSKMEKGLNFVPIKNIDHIDFDIKSMATLENGNQSVKYACVDTAHNCIITVEPNMATAKRIKPHPGDKFKPRHLASRPGRNDFLAVTGHHDNQVRIYTKCAKGLSKRWKLTDKIGCQGNGHDKLKNQLVCVLTTKDALLSVTMTTCVLSGLPRMPWVIGCVTS